MLIPFINLPESSRVWVYQANKTFSDEIKKIIELQLEKNIENWAAHGVSLEGSFDIIENRFVIIAVNEAFHSPSGCSIDASTHWFQELSEQLDINFMNRSVVFLNQNELDSFQPLSAKKQVELGLIQSDTIVFDNLIKTVSELKNSFRKPANQTWMKRFFIEKQISVLN